MAEENPAGIVRPELARREGVDPDARLTNRLADALRGFMTGQTDPREFHAGDVSVPVHRNRARPRRVDRPDLLVVTSPVMSSDQR